MKNMLYIVAAFIGIAAVYFIFFRTDLQDKHPQPLDEKTALAYVSVWAESVRARDEFSALQKQADGDFYGQVGSLAFEYQAAVHTLIVRAYIFPYSDSFVSKPDLLPELNRIAREEPDSVSGGTFEVSKGRWEPEKESSLFLRIDVIDTSLSERSFVSILEKFRSDSAVWANNRLTTVLGELVKNKRALNVSGSDAENPAALKTATDIAWAELLKHYPNGEQKGLSGKYSLVSANRSSVNPDIYIVRYAIPLAFDTDVIITVDVGKGIVVTYERLGA